MGFYDEISRYYDYIFPVGTLQLEFIKESSKSPGKRILDVACGSGGYSIELAKAGYKVTAVDIEDEMIIKVKDKADKAGLNIEAYKCDMRELSDTIGGKFDTIFCIGNSIVHLSSLHEVKEALKQMKGLLDEEGSLILQIINYDRIIKHNLTQLPPIRNDEIGLEFIRKYEYVEDKNVINFNTTLAVENKTRSDVFTNSIELFPIMSMEFEEVLKEAGFEGLEFYGDFNYAPYDENSYMLVVKAR
ncbi:MAG: class I SAM-dependent methyltransferase [Bacillota bacterium]